MTTLPVLLLSSVSLLALAAPPHPHVPRVLKLGLTQGELRLNYFTMPFNEKLLADVKSGFSWHAGFCMLESAHDLKVGDATLPAGKWKLNFRKLDGDGWAAEFTTERLARARMLLMRARAQKNEEEIKKVEASIKAEEEKGAKEIVVPFKMAKADDEEHLRMRLTTDGWVAKSMGDPSPTGGVELTLAADFGTLHGRLAITEVMEAGKETEAKEKAKDKDAEKGKDKEPAAVIRIERDDKGELVFRFRGQAVTKSDLANLVRHTVKPVLAAGGADATCDIVCDRDVKYDAVKDALTIIASAGVPKVFVRAEGGDAR